MERHYRFSLSISYVKFQQYYSGAASSVLVRTHNGLKLQLAAAKLRPYLTHSGINGIFELITDENNKFKSLIKL